MRIVVFSDSHRNYTVLKKIVAAQREAEAFIHLGDGEGEFEDLRRHNPDKLMLGVYGNCDFIQFSKVSDMVNLQGKKIFFTHGHAFRVKSDLAAIKREARGIGADIVLFGHTHIPLTEYDEGLYLLNPGSVTAPLNGRPSYGIVDITPAGVATSIVYL